MRRPAVGRSIEEAERVEWERERSRGSGKGESRRQESNDQ